MFKRISYFSIFVLIFTALLANGVASPIFAGSPVIPVKTGIQVIPDQIGNRVPSQLYTGPITILSANVPTTTYTTTARFMGDATYIDAFLSSSGTGYVTATLYLSSNASDWARAASDTTISSSGTATFTRYTAYGAYYRFLVQTNASITPSLRIVQKP
jgi:hypothetical protein